MKKILSYFLFTLAAIFIFAACSDDKETKAIVLSTSEETVGPDGAVLNIDIKSSVDWTAYASADWVEITPARGSGNGTVEIRVSPNFSLSERFCIVAVTDGVDTGTAKIIQNQAGEYGIVADTDILFFEHEYSSAQITKGEHRQVITLTTAAASWDVTHDSWIHVEKDGNRAIVTVDTYYGPTIDREGKIVFGGDNFEPKAEVKIYQTQFLVMEDAQGFFFGDFDDSGLTTFVVSSQTWTIGYRQFHIQFHLELANGLESMKFEPGRYKIFDTPTLNGVFNGYEGEEYGYPAPKGTYLELPDDMGMINYWLMTDGYVDVKKNAEGEYLLIAVVTGYNWETNEESTFYIRIPSIPVFEDKMPRSLVIDDIGDVVMMYGGIPTGQEIYDLKQWALYICHGDTYTEGKTIHYVTGGVLTFYLFMDLTNDGLNMDEGTYDIELYWPWKPFTYFNSWYADAEEQSSGLAPRYFLTGGTITISRQGSDYTLEFEVSDERYYSYTGSYTGPIRYVDNSQ